MKNAQLRLRARACLLAGALGDAWGGAGAAMRIAPLAFFLDPAVDADRQTIRDVSRITHHNDEAYTGALAVVIALRVCTSLPHVPEDLLDTVYWLVNPQHRTLTVLRWTPDGYLTALTAGGSERVRAEPFEAVEIDLDLLFEDEG